MKTAKCLNHLSAYVVGTLIFLVSVGAKGEIYSYHPQSRLYLGGGYNPFYPNDGYLACTENDGVKQVDTAGAVSSQVQMSIVRSREDFYKMVDFSTSIAGSYAFLSGGGNYHFFDESAFHSDSLSWIVLFRTDYGRFVLKNPRLKNLYSGYSSRELFQSCGSEVITEERRAVMVYALFTVKNISSSHRREIEANFRASASGAIWRAEMESSYKSILATAMARSQVQLTVNAIGGSGIQDLADLIRGSNENPYEQYSKVPGVISGYIGKMTKENSVPVQYVTTHLSALRPRLEKRYSDFKSIQVGRLYMIFADLQSALGRLQGILFGSEGEEYELDLDEREVLVTRMNEYGDAVNSVYAAAEGCYQENGGNCIIPKLNLSSIQWPQKTKIPNRCEDIRYEALMTGCIDRNIYVRLRYEERLPLCAMDGRSTPVLMGDMACKHL